MKRFDKIIPLDPEGNGGYNHDNGDIVFGDPRDITAAHEKKKQRSLQDYREGIALIKRLQTERNEKRDYHRKHG